MEQAAVILLGLYFATCSATGPLHAQCRVEWNFGVPCWNVYVALVSQIKLWSTADNCQQGGEKCLYTLETANIHLIAGKHSTLSDKNVEDITLKLIPFDDNESCHVSGFSVSETWYLVLDYGTNYCNLHNLVEGSSLDKAPGYAESTNDFKCTQYSAANCTIY
ncbi:hypothetical protein NDU88_005875 [Pleurodeles waltl]|uniref:C-type lectin domain-containing protein n=1 Tax=Pleurodeles waltl TaxID=8319 RepID=A0AAV7MAN8_PLEWA|nr:hypothetical protein NDU88_005875 [Pleurodeles waltl]